MASKPDTAVVLESIGPGTPARVISATVFEMDLNDFQRLATIITPIALAWVAAIQARITKQSDQLSDLERRVMQARVEAQKEAVSRSEIERLSAQMGQMLAMMRQQTGQLSRLEDRIEGGRRG